MMFPSNGLQRWLCSQTIDTMSNKEGKDKDTSQGSHKRRRMTRGSQTDEPLKPDKSNPSNNMEETLHT